MALIAGKFKIEKEIGRGAYATVYSAVLVQPCPPLEIGDYVAIKSISTSRISSAQEKEKLENEINLMKTLNHPNIVKLYSVERLRSYYFLIMEYCNDGDLIHYLHSQGSGIQEELIRSFMIQIGDGLNYLHSHQIVHRDLKPHNILISRNKNTNDNKENSFSLKIADFGFARFLRPSDMAETICGSPIYMAPEIQFGSHYSANVDMWSIGVILYELITTKTPFPNIKSQYELAQELKNRGSQPYSLPMSAQASPELRNLVTRLLTVDPEKRMTLSEFLTDPFFKDSSLNNSDSNNFQINENLSKSNNSLNNLSVSDSFEQVNLIKRRFSFLMASGSISGEFAENFLNQAKESALEIVELLASNQQNVDNFLVFDILTTVCEFLMDFLAEYRHMNDEPKEELENQILEFVEMKSKEAEDSHSKYENEDENKNENENLNQNEYENQNQNEYGNENENEDKLVQMDAIRFLYERGIDYARNGAIEERKIINVSEENGDENGNETYEIKNFEKAQLLYKRALAVLMPIAYQIRSDDFTNLVREIYLQISMRSEGVEKKNA